MISLALLLIGFSVVSALLLTVTHFRTANYSEQPVARNMGLSLVAALAGLQIAHWGWLYLDRTWIDTGLYRMLLFTVAPAFWAFSQPLLKAQTFVGSNSRTIIHALPIAIAPWLGRDLALPLAFVIGAGYLLALARDVHHLRMQRDEYAQEIVLLGTIFVIAVGVALLGVLPADAFAGQAVFHPLCHGHRSRLSARANGSRLAAATVSRGGGNGQGVLPEFDADTRRLPGHA
ncbi:MAG TPA: hypothetical protein PKM04_04850 [Accumulibacter sp.]|nr:hypothetical protein [Accumulibacter sp.]